MKRHTRRDLVGLFLLALTVRLVTAALIARPGYMDVSYYAAGARQLAQGGGLSEPFLWNYLDDPAGLPHTGFLYWMPLPSLLAAPLALLFPGSFFALQFPFVVVSALVPLVAYGVGWGATGRRRIAWLGGLVAVFSGFFFPYWTLPETFAPTALLGSVALWLAGKRAIDRRSLALARWAVVGVLAGLAHLTRPDGLLLLIVALVGVASSHRQSPRGSAAWAGTLVVLGYLLVMAPWFARNLSVIGAPLSPGGTKTLWLRTYDDLFCYRCDLSPGAYLAWGWGNILRSKLQALGVNLERFLAENCLVFLLPFVAVGLYRLRRRLPFSLSLVYLCLTYLAHSLAFTFPGPRGGFFHASAAVLPFLVAAGAEGLEAAVGWAGRRRRWNVQQARTVFAVAVVAGAVALSAHAAMGTLPAGRGADAVYVEIGQWLTQQEVEVGTVMVANPPAFWYHTGYPAVVVPNGDVETLLRVADRYGVVYVVLDRNHPVLLAGLYSGEQSHPCLQPAATWGPRGAETIVYTVEP